MDELSQHQPVPAGIELTPEEIRVLGCLIEKSHTTPDDYPLSANALMRACNQSTSRDPVVSYDQHAVESTVTSLKSGGLVRFVHQPTGRATTKYRHIADEAWQLDDAQVSVLGLLMLRGPQTVSELKTRAERLHPFGDLDSVTSVLESLSNRAEPLAVLLERRPGQKEARWMHLIGGAVNAAELTSSPAPSSFSDAGDGSEAAARTSTNRIASLEREVVELRSAVREMQVALGFLDESEDESEDEADDA